MAGTGFYSTWMYHIVSTPRGVDLIRNLDARQTKFGDRKARARGEARGRAGARGRSKYVVQYIDAAGRRIACMHTTTT